MLKWPQMFRFLKVRYEFSEFALLFGFVYEFTVVYLSDQRKTLNPKVRQFLNFIFYFPTRWLVCIGGKLAENGVCGCIEMRKLCEIGVCARSLRENEAAVSV